MTHKIRSYLMMSSNPHNNKSLWAIGWMSFFCSTATVMVFTLLPIFLTDVLGASKTKIGFIEGVSLFLAFVTKVFSGVLSDYWRSRKPIMMVGTFFSIVIKIMFALATSMTWIFAARSLDRIIKGIRTAPTDALIADLSQKNKEGSSYGIRYSLYMFGSVFGGIIAAGLMRVTDHNYRLIFWASIIPATLAFVILIFFVTPAVEPRQPAKKKDWNLADIKFLPPIFWQLLIVTFLLMMARFSESFLTLRAKDHGWSVAVLPLMMVAYELVHASAALPIGKLADRWNRHKLLLAGILVLAVTNCVILFSQTSMGILWGMILAGLHMGMTQGLISALIAESTLPNLRGTAFALYYLTCGTAVFIGNIVAGQLSDWCDGGAFWGGLVFALLSAAYLIFVLLSPEYKAKIISQS
ncbi:MAG: MFS transporter [Alphaproteobacteria bacterium]|nr:MFS transporter [Alphaproteobacteria bacterium]